MQNLNVSKNKFRECRNSPNLEMQISNIQYFKISKKSQNIKSAGPCLPGAPRLREWSALSFYQLEVIAFQAIRLCFYAFRGHKYPHDLPHQIKGSGFLTTPKFASFSSLFPRLKNQKKTAPKASKKR